MISPKKETGPSSSIQVASFDFEPDPEARKESYKAYSDEVVLAQWSAVLPETERWAV